MLGFIAGHQRLAGHVAQQQREIAGGVHGAVGQLRLAEAHGADVATAQGFLGNVEHRCGALGACSVGPLAQAHASFEGSLKTGGALVACVFGNRDVLGGRGGSLTGGQLFDHGSACGVDLSAFTDHGLGDRVIEASSADAVADVSSAGTFGLNCCLLNSFGVGSRCDGLDGHLLHFTGFVH